MSFVSISSFFYQIINEAIGMVLFILKFISLSNFIVECKDKRGETKNPATAGLDDIDGIPITK